MKDSRYRILWKGQVSGPYTREEVEGMLAKNEIGVWAEISEDNSDWKPITDWRNRKTAFQLAPKVAPASLPSEPFEAHVESEHRQQLPEQPELPPLPVDQSSYGSQSDAYESYTESRYVDGGGSQGSGGFFYWALMPLRKYGVFTGRARRKEYWLFSLLTFLLYFAIAFTEVYIEAVQSYDQSVLEAVYVIDVIVFLLLMVPNLAVVIRRLHDTNRTGWWLLISFTGIGLLILFLFSIQEGTNGDNDYGPDPVRS